MYCAICGDETVINRGVVPLCGFCAGLMEELHPNQRTVLYQLLRKRGPTLNQSTDTLTHRVVLRREVGSHVRAYVQGTEQAEIVQRALLRVLGDKDELHVDTMRRPVQVLA